MKKFDILFAVDVTGESWLIHEYGENIESNIFDGTSVNDNINNYKDLPYESGVYFATLIYEDKSEHTSYGWEYDSYIRATNIEKLTVNDNIRN